MSCVIATGPPAVSVERALWPEGQVYFEGDSDATERSDATTRLWESWAEEDAYPLVFKENIVLKPEYRGIFDVAGNHPYQFKRNCYARGGIAWSAAYAHARKHPSYASILDNLSADIIYDTSDFDTVACTLKSSYVSGPKDVLAFLSLKEGQDWPREPSFRGVLRKLDEITLFQDYRVEGQGIDWTKLATFFDNKLKLNDRPLTANNVKGKDHDTLASDFDLDFGDDRHEDNVTSYCGRYGLSPDVPYLMRVKGFGFVETPTIQVGQLLDTLSDYERCGEQSGIGVKAKYRRRLQRLEHSWNVHTALKKNLNSQQLRVCPFVLSEDVAELLQEWMESPEWGSFFQATDPKSFCYEMDVDINKKTVTSGKKNDCAAGSARMNCAKMMPHAFSKKTSSKIYSDTSKWTVRRSTKRELHFND